MLIATFGAIGRADDANTGDVDDSDENVKQKQDTANTASNDGDENASKAKLHKQYVSEFIEITDESTRLLKSIQDADSARSAVPTLKVAKQRLEALQEKMKALGEVPPDQNSLNTTPLGRKLLKATNAMVDEMRRISENREIQAVLEKAFEE